MRERAHDMPAARVDLEAHLRRPVAELLAAAGLRGEPIISPLEGGDNNRAFRVETAASVVFLKIYFHHEDDRRDRLGAEFGFTTFAWRHGVRCIPQPLRCDREHRIGCYGFIDGRPFSPGHLTPDAVDGALSFFKAVNLHRAADDARALPPASEACFSLEEHLERIERRLHRLLHASWGAERIDRDAAVFVRTELAPRWRRLADRARRDAVLLGAAGAPLSAGDRCISPSDFGFHNALRGRDGSLYFIDFEYAGWDDPAKTVCDFLWQPAVPVAVDCFDLVRESVAAVFPTPERHRRRISLLFPLYGIKWCCIVLNDFLPVGRARRSFARASTDGADRRAAQLERARHILRTVDERSR